MNWNKSVTLPDGTTLTASASTDRSTVVSYTASLPHPTTGKRNRTVNFFSHHSWGGEDFLNYFSDEVWEKMFSHYEHICRSISLSELTDFQVGLLEVNRVNSMRVKLSESLSKLPISTQVFFIMAGDMKKHEDEAFLKTVSQHVENLPVVTDLKTAFYYLMPGLEAKDENLAIAYKNGRYYLEKVAPEAEDFYAVACLAAATKNEETLKLTLREMAAVSDFDRESISHYEILNFPLRVAKFRNYLMDLTGEDFRKLINNIPKAASGASAIKIAERILNSEGEKEKQTLYLSAQEKHMKVFETLAALDEPDLLVISYRYMMEHVSRPHVGDLVQAFFSTLTAEDVARRQSVLGRIERLFGEGTSAWITPRARANDILESLCEVLPAEEVVKTIEEVISEKQNLTAPQWEKFVKTVDVYKDLPVGWWKPLVMNVRNG